MPELPEVETIKQDLKPLVGLKISKFIVRRKSLLRGGSLSFFEKKLHGARVINLSRRAKVLVITLSTGYSLMIHLKMTGQLVMVEKSGGYKMGGHPIVGVKTVPNKFTHIELHLLGGVKLYFNDVRRFGYWQIVSKDKLAGILNKYGPEPLAKDFTFNSLVTNLDRRAKTTIKAALLDQKTVAGLGNIYVDESLFKADIRPMRRVGTLTQTEIKKLRHAIKQILALGVKARGTSFDSYVDGRGQVGNYWSKRLVYGRDGQLCKRCKNVIIKTKVAGRGTHYCPICQK